MEGGNVAGAWLAWPALHGMHGTSRRVADLLRNESYYLYGDETSICTEAVVRVVHNMTDYDKGPSLESPKYSVFTQETLDST